LSQPQSQTVNVRIALLALALAIAAAQLAPLWAQAEPQNATPEARLVRSEEGFAFDLAGGFRLGMHKDGYYLLGSKTIPGLILIKALPGLTAAELNRSLRSGYADRTVQLTPEGAAEDVPIQGGSGRLAEVSGSLMKDEVRGLLAGYLRPEEGGLLIFAVTTPDQWPDLQPIARQIAESVALFDPDEQELVGVWKERLSGFQLMYAPQGSDPKDAEEIFHLCGDGSFVYQQPAAEPSSADRAGSWKIVAAEGQASIEFTFADGTSRAEELSREDFHTYLGKQRYFVLPTDQCQ
jgi:hypothetical protein